MNGKNKVLITYGLYVLDIISITISFFLATYLRFGNMRDMRDKTSHFSVCLVFILFATLYVFIKPWHNGFIKRKPPKEFWEILKMNVVIIFATQTIMFFLKWADGFSRWVMIAFAGINLVLTFAVHMIFKNGMRVYFSSELVKSKVLVITDESLKREVEEKLKEHLDASYQIIDIVVTDDINEEFFENAMQMAVDEIFVFAPDYKLSKRNELIKFFDDMGVACNFCVEIPGMDSYRSSLGVFGDYSVMIYNHVQKSYKKLMVKRAIDILGSLFGSVITVIITPFVALAIKIDSPGPVFFSQTRIGRNGRRFKIYKFRSMYMDAEERKKELQTQNEVEGLMFKMENDPRITKVGKFIRKTSIDELPQFFNILKGDMSLVGTRPPTEDEFEKYNQYYRRRLSMTPGLSGLWQVSGRSDIDDFDDVVKLDLQYIDQWSLWLDIKILFKTVQVVFTGRGSK